MKRANQAILATVTTALLLCSAGQSGAIDRRDGVQPDRRPAQSTGPSAESGTAASNDLNGCLTAPSRQCALQVALRITADEELAIERSKVLLVLAETLHELGDEERARQTARLAKEEAGNIGISIGTERKLVDIARVQARLGNLEEMRLSIEEISDPYMRTDAVGGVVEVLAKDGDGETIGDVLSFIEQSIRAIDHALIAADILIDGGHDRAARTVLEAVIPRIDNMRHTTLQVVSRARLAASFARLGDRRRAQELLAPAESQSDDIQMRQDRAAVQAAFAVAYLRLGDLATYEDRIERAYDLATGVLASYDRDTALNSLVIALAAGDRFEQAVESTNNVTSIRQRIDLLKKLSDLAENDRQRRMVAGLSRSIIDSLANIDSRFERDMARYAVVNALARIGQIDPAMDAIAAMEDVDDQARALAYIARALD